MRCLFDQSTDRRLAAFLRQAAHDVTIIAVDYPASLPDEEVLSIAQREGRVLITEDRDFGDLVCRHGRPHAGVVLLRLPRMELSAKVARLLKVLAEQAPQPEQLVVVTEKRVRVWRGHP